MATEIEQHATELLKQLYECDRLGEETSEAVEAYLKRRELPTSYGYELIDLGTRGLAGTAAQQLANPGVRCF